MQRTRNTSKPVLLVVVLAGLAVGAALGLALAVGRDLPHVEALENFEPSSATTVLAADGSVLTRFFVEKRLPVPLSRVPPALVRAVIAVEDHRFYQHPGLDVIRVFGALYADIKAGRLVQGASTITQQLARNLFLTREKTLARKLRELFLSFQIEQRYSKDEILELYLNQIYLGAGAYGVRAAAQTYFGKEPGELTLGECALLAGLPRSPEGYSPFRHPKKALRRRNIVLRAMVREGYLDPAAARRTAEEPLRLAPRADESGPAPFFSLYVRRKLVERFGENRVYRGGMTVAATLDPALQAAAQKAAAGRPGRAELIVLKAGRGAVLAWVGGDRRSGDSADRAAPDRAAPGAAFLPVLYAAAIDSGLSQSDIISDAPDLWPGMDEADGYRAGPGAAGEMTLRLALETSAQTAAVNLLGRIGIDYAAAAAQRMGIPSPLPHSLAPALGTMKTTLFELAAAYNTLAGGGMHVGPYAITEVRDASGVVLYRAVPKRRKVLETEAAAIVTDMMTGCVDPGRPAAGKAGFDEERGVALFVGYTPGLLAAVRVETNAARPDPDAGRAVWLDFMREVLADRPYEDFPLPMGVVLAPMNVYTGRPAEPGDPAFVMAAFREGRAPGADSP